jgi:hypothetical protein
VPEFEMSERGHLQLDEGTLTSGNWSGARSMTASPSSLVTNVVGTWNVPVAAPGPDEGINYSCSSWVGMDDGAGTMLQAGATTEVQPEPGGGLTRRMYAWWEWLPGPEVSITNVPVSEDDIVVCALGATPGTNQGEVFFFNVSRGIGTSFSVEGAKDGNDLVLDATWADWIVERPTQHLPDGTIGPTALADYNYVSFNSCSALAGDGKEHLDLAGPNVQSVEMYSPHYRLMSKGTITSPSSILCTWQGVYD